MKSVMSVISHPCSSRVRFLIGVKMKELVGNEIGKPLITLIALTRAGADSQREATYKKGRQ